MPVRTTAWPPGTPCWIDYGAADIESATAFYAGVLDWTYVGGEPEYGGYLTCQATGHAAAGMAPQQGSLVGVLRRHAGTAELRRPRGRPASARRPN
jgi:predicted enzyme related to lactoylglutathione lyase